MPRMGEPINPAVAAELAKLARRIERHRAALDDLEQQRNRLMRRERRRGVPVRAIGAAAGLSGPRVARLTET